MKKFISAVLAALMAVSLCALAACGGDDDKDKDKGNNIEPTKYTLTYDANGGTGTAPAVESYAEGATVTVKPATTFTHTGYAFTKWNDGTTDIAAGATFKMPAKNVTLKAQWEAQPQLYGVWSLTANNSLEDVVIAVTMEFTIMEGDNDFDIYATMAQTMTRTPTAGTAETRKTLRYIKGNEEADKAGTYTFEDVPGLSLVWSETNKTLSYAAPSGPNSETTSYPLAYAPLPENVSFDGDYWAKFEGDDEVTTLKVNGKNATLSGGMSATFTMLYIGNYAVALVEGAPQYTLEKTENGLRVYDPMSDSNIYDFKKGTAPASGTSAE